MFVSGLQTVSCQQTRKFSWKSHLKSLVKAFVVLGSNQESCTNSSRVSTNNRCFCRLLYIPFYILGTPLVFITGRENCALSTNLKTFLKNSKKITNLLLKQQSTFTCSGDIVFTREIDRLGPGGHESEAKVHTSFRPSAGPCKNLRGGGGGGGGGTNLASTTLTITGNLQFFCLYNTGHPTQD